MVVCIDATAADGVVVVVMVLCEIMTVNGITNRYEMCLVPFLNCCFPHRHRCWVTFYFTIRRRFNTTNTVSRMQFFDMIVAICSKDLFRTNKVARNIAKTKWKTNVAFYLSIRSRIHSNAPMFNIGCQMAFQCVIPADWTLIYANKFNLLLPIVAFVCIWCTHALPMWAWAMGNGHGC